MPHLQITALIIENTFMSLPRLIPTAMPWLGPFSFLCHQKWESYLKVTSSSSPPFLVCFCIDDAALCLGTKASTGHARAHAWWREG